MFKYVFIATIFFYIALNAQVSITIFTVGSAFEKFPFFN
jgi:hypothetical protein